LNDFGKLVLRILQRIFISGTDVELMADRSGKAVETHDDEDIAGGDLAQQLCQHRAESRGAGVKTDT